jgi:hypothetical protein
MRPGAVEESRAGARLAIAKARLADHPAPPKRPNARQRADQGLVEGRLIVIEASPSQVNARWRGEGHLHRLGWAAGHWHCTCDARTDACSHLLALKRVIAIRSSEER